MVSFSRLGIWGKGADELEDVGSYIDIPNSPPPSSLSLSLPMRIRAPSSPLPSSTHVKTGLSVPPPPPSRRPPPAPLPLPIPISNPSPSHPSRHQRTKSSSSPNLRSPTLSPTFLLHNSQPPAPVPLRLQTSSLIHSSESPFHARSSHPHLIQLPSQPCGNPGRPTLGIRGSSFGSYCSSSNASSTSSGSSHSSSSSTASGSSRTNLGEVTGLGFVEDRSVSWDEGIFLRGDDSRGGGRDGGSVGMERKRSRGKEKNWGAMGVNKDSLLGLMERGRGGSA